MNRDMRGRLAKGALMEAATNTAAKPPLKILLCSPRGFCAGVVRAIDAVERALAIYGGVTVTLH
jgi:4-hydroxy-3-methylbut-2-en-1-yl diphosphate reductase